MFLFTCPCKETSAHSFLLLFFFWMLQFQNIILPPFLVVKSHCPCGYISVHQRKDLINKVDLCVLNTEAPCLQLEAALCSARAAEWHRQATSSLSTNFYYIQADCENRFQTAARLREAKVILLFLYLIFAWIKYFHLEGTIEQKWGRSRFSVKTDKLINRLGNEVQTQEKKSQWYFQKWNSHAKWMKSF